MSCVYADDVKICSANQQHYGHKRKLPRDCMVSVWCLEWCSEQIRYKYFTVARVWKKFVNRLLGKGQHISKIPQSEHGGLSGVSYAVESVRDLFFKIHPAPFCLG